MKAILSVNLRYTVSIAYNRNIATRERSMTPEQAKAKAIQNLKVSELADRLGISTSAIYQWQRVPVDHCGTVCEMCGWVVQPYDLQPAAFDFMKKQGVGHDRKTTSADRA